MKFKRDKIRRMVPASCFIISLLTGISAGADCTNPRSAKDVVDCVMEKSPSGERARLDVEVSKANENAASRLPNPTLSLQSGFLRPNNQSGSDHQISLTQPIDIGGKRGSRIREAKAGTQQLTANQEQVRVELTIETLSKLNRLRQLLLESKVISETARTLEKLLSLFKNRPSLTPEQATSQALFRTALSDLDLKSLSLDEELKTIYKFFAVAAGFTPQQLASVLPGKPLSWEAVTPVKESLSPARKRTEADLSLAVAQLDSQKALSWPEFAVGPYAQLQRDGANENKLFGIALTMEIPVLSLNLAGREAGYKGVSAAERNKELLQKEELSEQARLLEVYEQSVDALEKLPQIKTQEAQHDRLEKLFQRGMVPSALVIESHRQSMEFLRARHEREEKALEALWRLKALQGKISEATL